MKFHELMNMWELSDMLDQGYVRFKTHNEFPELEIYEYTEKAVHDKVWNDVTMKCRGLIVNTATQEILARPFDKFFNYGQSEQKISLSPEDRVIVHDKMDGSLGILYRRPDGLLAVATKGSFHSEQADWATQEIRKHMTTHFFEDEWTWLFEIIYPTNRIVLDYKGWAGLVLLGARNIQEGDDALPDELLDWKGKKAARFRHKTLQEALEAPPRTNAEGFVVYLPDKDVRVKIKQEDYVLLHKIVTGLTKRRIWENLVDGKTLEDMCAIVPDEWHEWLKQTYRELRINFSVIKTLAESDYRQIRYALSKDYGHGGWSDKDFALLATDKEWTTYPGMVFALNKGKNIDPMIWQLVKPRGDE